MGWTPQPRWDRRRKRWYTRLRGRQYVLGADLGEAFAKFARLYREAYGDSVRRPQNLAELVGTWLDLHPSAWHTYVTADFADFAASFELDDLPRGLLEDFDARLRTAGNGPQTRRHKVRYAARILRWAQDREWLDRLPKTPKIPRPPAGHRDIATARVVSMVQAMSDPAGRQYRTGLITRFILATGCRPGEARALKWSHVDRAAREARLRRHKTAHRTGRDRVIYLGDEALEVLDEAGKVANESGHVFCNNRGRPWDKDGLRRNLWRWFRVSPNQLRHTWAQHALDQTTREDVAKLLGHTGTHAVDVYCQIRDRRAHEVTRSLKSPMASASATKPAHHRA